MGSDAYGHICFGILVDEDYELPWETEDDRDIDGWWRAETGYVPPFELYAGDGYAPGIETVKDGLGREEAKDKTLVTAYYNARHEWDKAHPLPVEMVNVGGGDDPIWIVTVPETIVTAKWGEHKKLDPLALAPLVEVGLAAFTAFCAKYGIEGEPAWYLGSYWG